MEKFENLINIIPLCIFLGKTYFYLVIKVLLFAIITTPHAPLLATRYLDVNPD